MMRFMKNGLAILLLLCVLFSCVSVFGESKALTISLQVNPSTKQVEIVKDGSKKALETKLNAAVSGEITYTLTDMTAKSVIYTETKPGASAGAALLWTLPYYDTGMTAKKPVKRLRAAFTSAGKELGHLDLFYTYVSVQGKSASVTVETAVWYTNNTACCFGPAFRDIKPTLTDKWYTFTPLDLTKQGTREFDYVASNMYVIGKVYVTVRGDDVTVTYHNFYEDQGGNTETLSEFLYFFHDLKSVREVEPENMGIPGFEFGRKISIENDLEGDTNVLLFIRNRVTYRNFATNSQKLTRFWPNLPERKALREEMIRLMNSDGQ